jgi:integrase
VRHHYCAEDPCKRLDKLPKETGQIAILDLEEVKRLLAAALSYKAGATAATVAIAVFAGLRPSELNDLKKEDVNAERIRVSGGKLRRTHKRIVPIPPVLAAWLDRFPFVGVPAGWDYKLGVLKRATKAKNWVQDILRHTSITFQAERDKDEARTAFNCGTSKEMMDRHYRNSVDDATVVENFWNLTPDAIRCQEKLTVKLPSRHPIPWPTKANLRELVCAMPLVQAAKKIGVSDVGLRKHCIREGIPLPPRNHCINGRSPT